MLCGKCDTAFYRFGVGCLGEWTVYHLLGMIRTIALQALLHLGTSLHFHLWYFKFMSNIFLIFQIVQKEFLQL